MHLLDWWPRDTALTFARPWLLLILLAIPLLAYLRGKRGPAAALTFSSTSALHSLGKTSAARAGRFLRADDPSVAAKLHMKGANPADVFGELRERKNKS